MHGKRILRKLLCAICLPLCILLCSGWGPLRDTSDYNDPDTYPNFPQFNSTKNNPNWGFTPDFASIREADAPTWIPGDYVFLEPGKTYDVIAFYENDAPHDTNETINARMSLEFPAVIKAGMDFIGNVIISADNAIPETIWSSLTFYSEQDILISYVQGSAKIFYNNAYGEERVLPNEGIGLFGEGQLIGYNLDGKVKGGDEHSAYIIFQITADYADFEIAVSMRKSVNDKWKDSVSVKPGGRVWLLLEYTNTGAIQQSDVVIKNVLPLGATLVPDSSYVINPNHPDGISVSDDVTSEKGIDIGNYAPGTGAQIFFQIEMGEVPFEQIKNTAHVETRNGSKTFVSGIDTRADSFLSIENSMDNPLMNILVSIAVAAFSGFIGGFFSHRFSLQKKKKEAGPEQKAGPEQEA